MSLVEFETDGPVAIVTINRPDVRNAVDLPTADALAEAFRRFDADDSLSVAVLTGSQGEPRAALARIASDEHPDIALTAGDRVIFSSRAIPGNEKAVGSIINNLIEQGIEVITDRTELVHVSGHPRRGELAKMYEWTKPRIAIPAHGEPLHLAEHAKFARQQGVPEVVLVSVRTPEKL